MRHERIYVLGLPGKGFLFVKGTTEKKFLFLLLDTMGGERM